MSNSAMPADCHPGGEFRSVTMPASIPVTAGVYVAQSLRDQNTLWLVCSSARSSRPATSRP